MIKSMINDPYRKGYTKSVAVTKSWTIPPLWKRDKRAPLKNPFAICRSSAICSTRSSWRQFDISSATIDSVCKFNETFKLNNADFFLREINFTKKFSVKMISRKMFSTIKKILVTTWHIIIHWFCLQIQWALSQTMLLGELTSGQTSNEWNDRSSLQPVQSSKKWLWNNSDKTTSFWNAKVTHEKQQMFFSSRYQI